MTEVTDEMVEAAAKALALRLPNAVPLDEDGLAHDCLTYPDDFAASERAVYMLVARAALEAALPLVVAGERARLKDAYMEGLADGAREFSSDDRQAAINLSRPATYEMLWKHSETAAIRADKGGETGG